MTYVMRVLPPTSPLSGFGALHGMHGLRGLGDALSYKCTSTVCYSVNSPSTDAVFKTLQSSINYFAKDAGFSPIGVDGILGAGTVAAAKKVAQYIKANGDTPLQPHAAGLAALTISKETLAAGASAAVASLQSVIAAWNLTPSAPAVPKPSTPAPQTSLPAPPDSIFSPSNGGGGKKMHWAWYAAGGLLAAGLVGGTYLLLTPPKGGRGKPLPARGAGAVAGWRY